MTVLALDLENQAHAAAPDLAADAVRTDHSRWLSRSGRKHALGSIDPQQGFEQSRSDVRVPGRELPGIDRLAALPHLDVLAGQALDQLAHDGCCTARICDRRASARE